MFWTLNQFNSEVSSQTSISCVSTGSDIDEDKMTSDHFGNISFTLGEETTLNFSYTLPDQLKVFLDALVILKVMFSRFCHLLSDITSDCLNSATKHYQRQRQRQRQVKSSHLAHLLEPIFGLVCPLSQTKYFPSPHKSFYAISVPFQVSNFVLHFFRCL